jgi:hypothetical protein
MVRRFPTHTGRRFLTTNDNDFLTKLSIKHSKYQNYLFDSDFDEPESYLNLKELDAEYDQKCIENYKNIKHYRIYEEEDEDDFLTTMSIMHSRCQINDIFDKMMYTVEENKKKIEYTYEEDEDDFLTTMSIMHSRCQINDIFDEMMYTVEENKKKIEYTYEEDEDDFLTTMSIMHSRCQNSDIFDEMMYTVEENKKKIEYTYEEDEDDFLTTIEYYAF